MHSCRVSILHTHTDRPDRPSMAHALGNRRNATFLYGDPSTPSGILSQQVREVLELQRRWAARASIREPSEQNTTDRKSRFEHVYEKGKWQDSKETPLSGTGSTIESSHNVRRAVISLVRRSGVRSILDVACGDLTWMRTLFGLFDQYNVSYTGVDIVSSQVDRLRAEFAGRPRRAFLELDLAQDALPRADLIVSRQTLQHLPAADALRVLHSFGRSGATYLLVTTYALSHDFRKNQPAPQGLSNLSPTEGADMNYIDLAAYPYTVVSPPLEMFIEQAHTCDITESLALFRLPLVGLRHKPHNRKFRAPWNSLRPLPTATFPAHHWRPKAPIGSDGEPLRCGRNEPLDVGAPLAWQAGSDRAADVAMRAGKAGVREPEHPTQTLFQNFQRWSGWWRSKQARATNQRAEFLHAHAHAAAQSAVAQDRRVLATRAAVGDALAAGSTNSRTRQPFKSSAAPAEEKQALSQHMKFVREHELKRQEFQDRRQRRVAAAASAI